MMSLQVIKILIPLLTLLNLILSKFCLCTLFFYSDANSAAPGDPSIYFTALDLGFDENEDFELTFDDLDAFEADDFLISEDLGQTTNLLDLQADR